MFQDLKETLIFYNELKKYYGDVSDCNIFNTDKYNNKVNRPNDK